MLLAVATAVALFLPGRSAAGTALADAAASMVPGEWKELVTANIQTPLGDTTPGGSDAQVGYADKLNWDPITNRIYLVNSDDPGDGRRFIAYDEATNAWLLLAEPWSGSGVAHQYGLTEIDVPRRRLWSIMPDGDRGYYYDFTTQTWTSFTIPPAPYMCCAAVAHFPERDSLIYAHGTKLREYNLSSGQWRDFSGSINTTTHAIAHYDPVHKLVIFGGGNESNRSFYKLNENGQVTALRQPPVNLESPRIEFVANPVAGNFLVFAKGRLYYSYDAVADVWTPLPTTSVPDSIFFGTEYGANYLYTLATAIPRYGIAFFASCEIGGTDCTVQLYKFAEPPPLPNAPTGLSAN